MDWQQPMALFIVGMTALLMARGWWQARHAKGRMGACGCPGAGTCGKPASFVVSGRKGEAPKISVGK